MSTKNVGLRAYRCDQCESEGIDCRSAVWSRGYYWCMKHADISYRDGKPVVEMGSAGKLIPITLLKDSP